jgi:alpha-beta hydrolase superfamily lysophospholipase
VRIYTAHLHPRKPPVLVREAFSWGALIFGPLWLLRHGVWVPLVISVAALVLIAFGPAPIRAPLMLMVFVLLGLFGNDLRRWGLGRRRFHLAHVVAARNHDEAYVRLLSSRSDQLGLAA